MDTENLDRAIDEAKKDLLIKNLTDDANTLASESVSAQAAISTIILAERLKACALAALHYEVTEAWEVENPNMVFSLMKSAAEQRATEPYTSTELYHAILGYALPFVDVLVRTGQMQKVN